MPMASSVSRRDPASSLSTIVSSGEATGRTRPSNVTWRARSTIPRGAPRIPARTSITYVPFFRTDINPNNFRYRDHRNHRSGARSACSPSPAPHQQSYVRSAAQQIDIPGRAHLAPDRNGIAADHCVLDLFPSEELIQRGEQVLESHLRFASSAAEISSSENP